jgi:hypothetical protein
LGISANSVDNKRREAAMTLQIEISPETEARLAAEAVARGMGLADYASMILCQHTQNDSADSGILTASDIEELSRRLSEGSETLPILPIEANNRESYYEDR